MREPLRVHDPVTTVRAGGVAAVSTCLPDNEPQGTVSARAYQHPALPGQVVVRLEPDRISAAADAEMDALGFESPEVSAPLGRMRHRTVGFPGWALLNDPAHARFALEVTREFKKASKRVKSKPGHAKEEFDAIAARLARSVPHFLPSFWEEVARVFLRDDAASFASQAFERARQAEKEFSLAVDEDARAAAFLEFALAGALSAKSLGTYARDLESAGAATAFDRFRELALGRTRGGMPPWAGMGRELRALAKAARRDYKLEEERFFEDVIAAPALARASSEFWKTYHDAAVAVARRVPTARKRLLELFPITGASWRGVSREAALAHFDLLEECGALEALADAATPADQLPAESLAAWAGRAFAYLGSCARSCELLVRLAPRLAALGEPIAVMVRDGWQHKLSLDLAELALEHGLTVASPASPHILFRMEGSTCDPVRTAGDPVLGPVLVRSVGAAFGDAAFEAVAHGKRGFLAARRAWLEGQIEGLENGLIADANRAVDELERRTSARTFADITGTLERLRAVSWSAVLARTLTTGLVAEHGWPAYEQAAQDLGSGFELDGTFPHLVLRSGVRAIALGPTGRLLEHDFAYDPRTEALQRVLYLDGAFLVTLRAKNSYEQHAYWSTDPKRRFKLGSYLYSWGDYPVSTDLASGGTTIGHKAIHAGDTEFEGLRPHLSDGRAVWVFVHDTGKVTLREIDPATGRVGRASRPTFLEGYLSDPAPGRPALGWVAPAPRGLARSPLGLSDGLLGMRARLQGHHMQVEMIDGTHGEVPHPLAVYGLHGLLRHPGAPAVLVLLRAPPGSARGRLRSPALWTLSGHCVGVPTQDAWSGAGWAAEVPPAEFWHYFEPRDAESSAALRRVEERAAVDLLACAQREAKPDAFHDQKLPETLARTRAVLPGVRHPALQRAVAVATAKVASLVTRLNAVITRGEKAASAAPVAGPALELQRMLDALLEPGPAADMPPPDWVEWLTHPRARALLLDSPLVTDAQRNEQLELVAALLAHPLRGELATLRYFRTGAPGSQNYRVYSSHRDPVQSWTAGQSTYVSRTSWQSAEFIERNPSGTFTTPPDHNVLSEVRLGQTAGLSWLAGWFTTARAGRCVAWEPELPARLAEAAAITRAEACLLWCGAPETTSYVKDYLGPERRAALGLKLAEADAARGTFKPMARETLLSLLDAALPDVPVVGASPLAPDTGGESPVARLGAAWRAQFGARLQVPEEVVLACQKDLGPPVPAVELFRTFLEPGSSPLLNRAGGPEHPVFAAAAMLVPYLALTTPAGDPLGTKAPAFVEAVTAALDRPDLLLPLGAIYAGQPDQSGFDAMLDALGGSPTKLGAGLDPACTRAVDNGLIVAARVNYAVHFHVRTAHVRADVVPTLRALTRPMHAPAWGAIAGIVFLRSPGCRAMVERLARSPLPAGAFDANPAASVPALVARVAAKLGVGDAAAALYLQILALAEPTARAVQRWNDWDANQYRRASAELVARKLVIEGKRERAGRDVFLLGEWIKGVAKDLPMEGWKVPLYEDVAGALPRRLPQEPLPALFERAWRRVESGDAPKFEEVR